MKKKLDIDFLLQQIGGLIESINLLDERIEKLETVMGVIIKKLENKK